MKLTLDYPPLWLAGFAAAAWILGLLAPMSMPGWLGWTLVILAVGLMAAAAMQMLARKTTLDPHGAPSALVTGGVFRLSRNPIYLADLLILAGLCLLWHAPLGLVLVPALAAVLTRRFILPEEARLKAKFPDAFAEWSARTRRWI